MSLRLHHVNQLTRCKCYTITTNSGCLMTLYNLYDSFMLTFELIAENHTMNYSYVKLICFPTDRWQIRNQYGPIREHHACAYFGCYNATCYLKTSLYQGRSVGKIKFTWNKKIYKKRTRLGSYLWISFPEKELLSERLNQECCC